MGKWPSRRGQLFWPKKLVGMCVLSSVMTVYALPHELGGRTGGSYKINEHL